MSIDSITSNVRQIGNISAAGKNAINRLGGDLGLGLPARSNTAFYETLKPASYRQVQFAVIDSRAAFGRRNVVHEYPFAETPWIEDIGRSARRITMHGFLLHNDAKLGGKTLQAQITDLIAACESPGEGELMHPTLGKLSVGLQSPVEIEERWDKGGVALLTFTFIENGQRSLPNVIATSSTGAEADKAHQSSAKSFAIKVFSSLQKGAAVVESVSNMATGYASRAQALVNDATNILHLAQTFGRQVSATANDITNMLGLTSQAASARASVAAAASLVQSTGAAISPLTISAHTDAVTGLVSALAAASPNQADTNRMLMDLAAVTPETTTAATGIGSSINTAANAHADLLRRAAVIELAKSSASYQPTSYEDAITLRDLITGLLDAEILIAGDQGDDDAYASLRALKAAVSQDLTTRGANLSRLVVVSTNSPLPADVLAYRLYKDASRADDLIARALPIHPAFMPVSFRALAK